MKLWHKNKWMIVLVVISIMLTACGTTSKQRTAEQWLMLAQSGLVGKDDYRFTGSILQGFENGVSLVPFSFEGEVQEHRHITLHSESADTLIRNPAVDLDFLIKNYDVATIAKYTTDEATMRSQVLLHIIEKEEATTRRWKEQLKEELASITMSVTSEAAENNSKKKRQLQSEIDKGHQELEAMLQTLKVTAEYDLLVDTMSLLPTKLDGHIKLQYTKDDIPYSEYRTTNIRFDMFGKEQQPPTSK